MSNTNYNIAIIGQTGVGKSSLINYLFGEKIVAAGVGRPVTTNGFHEINHKIKDMDVKIYDSWGLEVGKEEQWKNELHTELKTRGIDKPASEWFHSIFYCIAASGGRIQDADTKIIKMLMAENYKVSIILTKADSISEEEEEEFINVISNELGSNIAIIPVCSEHKKTRSGEIIPFGKELVEKQSLIDLIDSLVVRIPCHCENAMLKELDSWEKNIRNKIEDGLGVFGMNSTDIQNNLSESSKSILTKVQDTGNRIEKESLTQYNFIIKQLGNSLSNKSRTQYEHIQRKVDKDLEWYEFPLIPLALALFPIIAIWNRKSDASEMNKQIDRVSNDLRKIINEKIDDLRSALEGVKSKISEDIT